MKKSVNLAVLHEMTDGDLSLERKMFKAFLYSASGCLAALENSRAEGMDQAWRQGAHAFKGICLNLGAERLSQLCKDAQDQCAAPQQKKKELLKVIQHELESVRQYLEAYNGH